MLRLLDQTKSVRLLKKYKIPVVQSKVCKDLAETKNFAKGKYPVVLKIDSEDVVHKSDVGAVKINISDEKELTAAHKEILANVKKHKKDARIEGMLVQKQIKGHNILIGAKRDPQFGPVIIFGLGGVLVEVLKDISKRIAPLTKKDAKEMISEIQAIKILKGYRGEDGADLKGLEEIILSLSKLMVDNKEIMEIDFNPVISNPKDSYVVDARIMVNDDV